jgi:type IV pilus assembly protein PilC
MPTFTYKAKSLQGAEHKGTIETTDPSQVARILQKRGLIVYAISEKRANQTNFVTKFLHRVSFTDVVVATRQLATMIEAGMVLSEAIDILADQQPNITFKNVLSEVSRDIKGGLDLATAFKKHPDAFPPLYANLIKSGEETGKLDIVLNQMADTLEKDREFRAKVRGAMIYPGLIITMMGLVISIMMIFVIPRLTSLYTQSNIDLPLPTKILITTSSFMQHFWWLIILMIISGVILLKRYTATPDGKYVFDSILLKTPVVGQIITGSTLTNFTRTFGLLITAGIPLLDALTVVEGVVDNAVYKKALEQCYAGISRGLTFSSQLQAVGVFPKLIPQMYRVGEETGKVDKVSFKMADYFESETDNLVKNITVVIEPFILIVLGLGVGFVVLSIILPIYKLTTSFS